MDIGGGYERMLFIVIILAYAPKHSFEITVSNTRDIEYGVEG